MPLMYVDESFNAQEFWLSGLVVPLKRTCDIEDALDTVVEKASSDFGVSSRAELHGYDVAQGKGDWSPLSGELRARLSVLGQALKVIGRVPDVHAYQFGLNRSQLRAKYAIPWPERKILIGHLAQRAHHAMHPDDHLVIVVDASPAQDSLRAHIRDLKRSGTLSKYNSARLRRIVDTLYFAESHESRLLQASDLVSYIHLRSRQSDKDPRAARAAKKLWDNVSGKCTPSLWNMSRR